MTSKKKDSATHPILETVEQTQLLVGSSKEYVSSRLRVATNLINRGGLKLKNTTNSNIYKNNFSDSDSSSFTTNSPNNGETSASERTLYASQFAPGRPRSLSGIAIRSFILGLLLSLCLCFSLFLAFMGISLWRAPFFISTLCLFHFLEYWATARANPTKAKTSSFLLTSNGAAYNIAHTCALLEMILCYFCFPRSKLFLPKSLQMFSLFCGLFLIIIGQSIRTLAILTAGPSFSHLVAHQKSKSHVLIQHGIYSILRHPSYFGFFWWGIGTQLVCGNIISLFGYTIVLFWFFKMRIRGEETLLVEFFGKEYEEYARRTFVAIPGLD
ncbi:Protein-S-isoprenylcysteine O-methyltransferase [Erysiphe necator]|nr:Protein-S-isoprenylcysteine O-methyltransferase [Erysiphe necator]